MPHPLSVLSASFAISCVANVTSPSPDHPRVSRTPNDRCRVRSSRKTTARAFIKALVVLVQLNLEHLTNLLRPTARKTHAHPRTCTGQWRAQPPAGSRAHDSASWGALALRRICIYSLYIVSGSAGGGMRRTHLKTRLSVSSPSCPLFPYLITAPVSVLSRECLYIAAHTLAAVVPRVRCAVVSCAKLVAPQSRAGAAEQTPKENPFLCRRTAAHTQRH